MSPRALTHDERKAAEAAFRGQPFHPSWSIRARTIYDGILATLERGLDRHLDVAHHDIPMTPLRGHSKCGTSHSPLLMHASCCSSSPGMCPWLPCCTISIRSTRIGR